MADALVTLSQLRIVRYPTATLLDRAWSLRDNFTAYDAMYVALAEAVRMKLITSDERLAAATRAHTDVELILLA